MSRKSIARFTTVLSGSTSRMKGTIRSCSGLFKSASNERAAKSLIKPVELKEGPMLYKERSNAFRSDIFFLARDIRWIAEEIVSFLASSPLVALRGVGLQLRHSFGFSPNSLYTTSMALLPILCVNSRAYLEFTWCNVKMD